MSRKEFLFGVGLGAVGALLLANLVRPEAPVAYTLPEPAGPAVSISASGDAAWALVGNRVYYLSLKSRSEVKDRIIYLIDDEELK
ncbi:MULTISPECIES: hypothetical protein [Deferrisoma]